MDKLTLAQFKFFLQKAQAGDEAAIKMVLQTVVPALLQQIETWGEVEAQLALVYDRLRKSYYNTYGGLDESPD